MPLVILENSKGQRKNKINFSNLPPDAILRAIAWELQRGLISRRKGFFEIFRKI